MCVYSSNNLSNRSTISELVPQGAHADHRSGSPVLDFSRTDTLGELSAACQHTDYLLWLLVLAIVINLLPAETPGSAAHGCDPRRRDRRTGMDQHS